MPTKSLAQNGVIALPVPKQRSQVATMATGDTTDPAANFVVEIEGVTGVWTPIGIFDGVAQGPVDSITGPSQYAWTDVPGAQNARARRTDAAGGDGTVAFEIVEA